MATILPTYDWTHASNHVEKARSRAYPWDEWLDGQIRKLDRITDFDGPAMSVERVIRTSANRRGIRVRIRVEGDSIYLQAHTEDARGSARGVTKSATKKAVKEAQAAKAEGIGNGVAPSVVITPKVVKAAAKPAAAPEPEAKPARTVKRAAKPSVTKAAANGKSNGKATATASEVAAATKPSRRKLVKA